MLVRRGNVSDVNHIKNIDLKSYAYPWQLETWREIGEDDSCDMAVVVDEANPVGFTIWRELSSHIEVLRLGVNPSHRQKGFGTALLDHIEERARFLRKLSVYLVVPEINCFPGHPDDVSRWLLNRDFVTTVPIIKDFATMYGEKVDGFKFVKKLEY